MSPQTLTLVIPVFDDWLSLKQLIEAIHRLELPGGPPHIVAVNDGASAPPSEWYQDPSHPEKCMPVEVIHLVMNMGHQRAIAIGLAHVHHHLNTQAVIVMDADGEDQPEHIVALVNALHQQPEYIHVAQRTQRTENFQFQFLYRLYKGMIRLLTGQRLDFGNFCIIPMHILSRLIYNANLWNNLAATVAHSRMPYAKVPLPRGTRYTGRSKMNLTALVIHGLSALSVYSEVVLVRVLILSVVLGVLAFIGLAVTVFIRLFTELAIPGWATSTSGILLVILLQSVLLIAGAVMTVLANRSQALIVPATDILKYIYRVETVHIP